MTLQAKALLCPDLKLYKKGKVREVYDFNDKLLIAATDNISAFDVVLPSLIPGKGALLNKISNFWFDFSKDIIKNHVISTKVSDFPETCQPYADILEGRSVLVWKTEMIELEAIVRGYLSGSGYKDYTKTGEICGIKLPAGLKESAKLEEPIFTPSTKAQEGHDINVDVNVLKKSIDPAIVDAVKEKSLELYKTAADYALTKGIIIADTKFEFGMLDGEIVLIDEVLTPDSSRFWPMDGYQPGKTPDSFDKQFVRDYLLNLPWDMKSPPPILPPEIVQKTLGKYAEALRRLTSS